MEMIGRMLAVAAILFLALGVAPPSMAAAKPTAEEALVLKKKKAEAERKAKAKKVEADRKAKAQKAAATRKATQKVAMADRKPSSQVRPARRDCGTFLQCLFGKRRTASGNGKQKTARDMATVEPVSWTDGKYTPGSIVVRTPERALYFVLGDGKALRYSVGVGREGFQWSGNSRIVSKQEWPTWRPPQVMIEREAAKGHFLPAEMEGGPENPLGARAMYIGGTMYRIHGTNNAASIGGAVSSGCIRMMNTDVIDLYERVKVGARVYVYQ